MSETHWLLSRNYSHNDEGPYSCVCTCANQSRVSPSTRGDIFAQPPWQPFLCNASGPGGKGYQILYSFDNFHIDCLNQLVLEFIVFTSFPVARNLIPEAFKCLLWWGGGCRQTNRLEIEKIYYSNK